LYLGTAAEIQFKQEVQMAEKLANEEYKIWKKQTPFLYDVLLTRAMKWPSLTVQWLPEITSSGVLGFDTHSLLLGTHTSRNDQDYVQIAHIDMPNKSFHGSVDKTDSDKLNKLNVIQKIDHEGEVNKARYCPQKPNLIATCASSGDVLIFDRDKAPLESTTRKCVPLLRLRQHFKECWGLAWSPNDQGVILTGSNDNTVALWDINKKTDDEISCQNLISSHSGMINDAQWSIKMSNVFGTASDDTTLQIHDTRSLKEPIYKFDNPSSEPFNSLSFNPFTEYVLASGSSDGTIGLWDLRKPNEVVCSLRGHSADISSVQWSPMEESILASSGFDRRLLVWDLSLIGAEQTVEEEQEGPPELVFMHGGHTNKILDFSWHPTLPWTFATISEDNIVQAWKIAGSILDKEESDKQEE
jgi:histone-binding protein RBBP4